MKKITFLALLTLGLNSSLNAQQWDWIFMPNPVDDTMNGIDVSGIVRDNNGNVYAGCQNFYSSLSFGNQQLLNTFDEVGRNIIAKLDASGNIVWTSAAAENEKVWLESMVTDTNGNLYTTGGFYGTYALGDTTFGVAGDNSGKAYLAKRDAAGNVIWAKHAYTTGDWNTIFPEEITIDPFGNIYISGNLTGDTAVFDGITVNVTGDENLFIAKYDTNGNILWIRIAAEGYQQQFPGISMVCDSMGNLFCHGNFNGNLLFNVYDETITVGEENFGDAFLAKYNPEGDLIWVRTHESDTEGDILCSGLSIDANDNIYTCGYFTKPLLPFEDVVLNNSEISGSNDGYVAKYNNNGNVLWAKKVGGGQGDQFVFDMQVSTAGDVYVLGDFTSSQISLGGSVIFNEGDLNSYLAKLDTDGNFQWSEHIGGVNSLGMHMALDATNNAIFATGNYSNVRFGDQEFTNQAEGANMFVAKFDMGELSTGEFSKNKMFIYPNPVKNVLNISNFTADASYTITDMVGRIVKTGSLETAIDVTALSQGTYIFSSNGLSHKFVKE